MHAAPSQQEQEEPARSHQEKQIADIMDADDPEQAAEDTLTHPQNLSLRKQATTVAHLLKHKPKNPFCAACRRAKLKHIRKYRGSYQRQAQSPGQILTADTVTSKEDAWQAVLMTDPVGVGVQGQTQIRVYGQG